MTHRVVIPTRRWTVGWAALSLAAVLLSGAVASAQPARGEGGDEEPRAQDPAAEGVGGGQGDEPAPPPDDAEAGGEEDPGSVDEPLMGEEEPLPPPPEPPAEGTAAAGAKDAGAKGAEVAADAKSKERPSAADMAQPTSEVYAEDWWRLSRPVFELHGYFRVRSEFFHNFALGRRDGIKPLWPQPPDHDYIDTSDNRQRVVLCGSDPSSLEACDNNTQAGANMRFRLNPELHISDNVRVRAQIDLLDNIVLGSTPQGYANQPGDAGGYQVVARGGYSPLGSFASTQWAPVAGVNSTKDSILVKRVWGEYSSPIGQLRFGRMPSHWGLGILANSGDGHDSDWQSTADRLMFITGIRSWDLYFGAAWDFANEGPNSAVLTEQDGQPYDLAQSDDVDQWVFVIVRRMDDQRARSYLAEGNPLFEGGSYVVYRRQTLANDTSTGATASLGQGSNEVSAGYNRRGAEAVIPDAWFRFRYKGFRLELEAAMIWGSIENTLPSPNELNYFNGQNPDENGWNIRQFGLASETSFRALDDRLRVAFKWGYASGDDDVESLAPIGNELQPQLPRRDGHSLDRTYSTFRFHPDYRVDLILHRNILSRVQGTYYFRPEIGYDFVRDPDGQKIGGDAAVVWSRASEFVQAPGHARDLGVELNFKVYYQAKDGVLNDDLDQMGGFYTAIEYGVLFPLDGLGYMPQQVEAYKRNQNAGDEVLDTETAQTVRWYLGILF